MDRPEEIAGQTAADRFRIRREALVGDLVRLLGPRCRVEPSADAAEGARLTTEFLAGRGAAAPNEWAIVSRHWGADEADALTSVLHRLSRNLGPRAVWLLTTDREPHAVPVPVEFALDNPLGFAGLSDDELRLLDRDVPAGLWLRRHTNHFGPAARHSWQLEVWGEPWLSATTRALRGIG